MNKLNQLPFLRTRESCGGRIYTREALKEEVKEFIKFQGLSENPDDFPDEGKVVYSTGWIDFYLKKNEESQLFIKKLGDLAKKYGVSFPPEEPAESDDLSKKYGRYYYLKLSKEDYPGLKGYEPERAKELETEKEKFKSEIIKLVDEFLVK